jgi:hypothetical protein
MNAEPPQPATADRADRRGSVRFDRNELAGAFGDIGTDLPLIVGMVLAAGLHSASVLICFGAMQVLTALYYRLPMPVQPLKAVAVLVIAQQLGGNVIYGAGLAIGATMLVLTLTGAVDWIARVVPKCVVRGIQFGLGLQLTSLAMKDYLRADGTAGYWLAGVGFVLTVLLLGHRRYPPALFVIALGVAYACLFKLDWVTAKQSFGFSPPQFHAPNWGDITKGFLLLALPQIPLSIGNSLLATRQIVTDLFPGRELGIRRLGFTYSLMNLIAPWFGGVPTCHGSGGLAGHYAFGARTGGSVVIYGAFYLVLGLFLSGGFAHVIQVFPKPVLGVILFFEGLTLLLLVRDLAGAKLELWLALMVGLAASGLPYGYVIGLVVGTLLSYTVPKLNHSWSRS